MPTPVVINPGDVVIISTQLGEVLDVLDTSAYLPIPPMTRKQKLATGVVVAGIVGGFTSMVVLSDDTYRAAVKDFVDTKSASVKAKWQARKAKKAQAKTPEGAATQYIDHVFEVGHSISKVPTVNIPKI